MSCVSYGAVFSRSPEQETELAQIDAIVAGHAQELVRTRKGRVWQYTREGVLLDVSVEQVEKVLWDCEEDLVSLGLLPEPRRYRVAFTARYCGDDADREIKRLMDAVCKAIGGMTIGPQHRS
jgi:hypothetical protein